MEASFSSLPITTSPSSSTPSSSSSLYPPLLFDLADDLWFYRSVLPLPSLSLPCLPVHFSPPTPDSSTLLAQCMITDLTSSTRPPLSSSSSSPSTPPDSEPQTHLFPWGLLDCDAYPVANHNRQENYAKTFCSYYENPYRDENETKYGGYSSLSDTDEDGDAYQDYRRGNAGDDEEAYHYYTAASDWEDEDAYIGYQEPSDCEVDQIKEDVLPTDPPHLHADDALSGIYDVGVLLKDQHQKRTQEVSHSLLGSDAASLVSAVPQIQLPPLTEQVDIKESIKLWAHVVASTLPWKAAAQARPLL